MSKKKFKAGLESVFDDSDSRDETIVLVDAPSGVPASQKVVRIKARGSSKDFTSDLDMLLEEALNREESEDKSAESEISRPKISSSLSPHRRIHSGGLDSLIRQTISVKTVEDNIKDSTSKRVTLTVEKRKLEKLKKIARTRKIYLKDILSDIIGDYLKKHEKHNS